MVLDDEQVLRYGDILNHFEEIDSVAYTQEGYFADCLARRSMACSTLSGTTADYCYNIDRQRPFGIFQRSLRGRLDRHCQRRTGADRTGKCRLYGGTSAGRGEHHPV